MYRIVHKFDKTIGFPEFLIPFWGEYLFLRTTLARPIAISWFWGLLIYAALIMISGGYTSDRILTLALDLLGILVWETPKVLTAEKLGKNLLLYCFLLLVIPALASIMGFMVFSFLLDIGVTIKFAFDNSAPTNIPPEGAQNTELN